MDFAPSSDRQLIADMLGRLLADQYDFGSRKRIAGSATGFDRQIWALFAEQGIIGALWPEEQGGFGGTGFDIAVIFEAVGRWLVVEPLLGTLMAGRLIGERPVLAEAVLAGSAQIAFTHYEPSGRYDLEAIATCAEPTADGWLISGEKAVVPQLESADYFIVSARTTSGLSVFLVPADAQGVSTNGYPMIDGGRGGDLRLTEVRVSKDALLGAEGAALPRIEAAVAAGIVALAAEAVGIMDVMRDTTIDYLRTRQQFGRPIGKFQALQHRMATLLIEIEQARSSMINAAAALAGDVAARELAVSAAKFTIGRVGTLLAEEAIQMHGGIGMTWELPLSHFAKRLIMIGHQLGDEDHHLERYIALGRAQTREDA